MSFFNKIPKLVLLTLFGLTLGVSISVVASSLSPESSAAASSTSVKLITGATVNSQAELSWTTSNCTATFDNESETSSDFTSALGADVSGISSGNGLSSQNIQYLQNNIQSSVPVMKFTGGAGCSSIILVPVAGTSATPSVPTTWYGVSQADYCTPSSHAANGCANNNIGPIKFVESSTSSGSVSGKFTYYAADDNENIGAGIGSSEQLKTTTSSITTSGAPGAIKVSANATTHNPGCYNSSLQSMTCPSGASDTNGNAIEPTTSCYVEGSSGGKADDNSWTDVSCDDLTTAINPASGAASTATDQSTDACDSNPFQFSWAVCPIVDALTAGSQSADSAISGLLQIQVNDEFNDNCTANSTAIENSIAAAREQAQQNGNAISAAAPANCSTSATNYAIWNDLRDISLSLLVIISLVMVISTALDIGPFDAYTVKKIFPRIVVAVIGITFSWEIGRLLVSFSDDLGTGVYQLIYSVIGGPYYALSGVGDGLIPWLVGAGAVGGVAGLVTLATVGPLAVLMLLLPAILSLAIGFLVIIFRRLLVVVCVVTAPVAFISFILPGTQGIWKLWTKTFTGALFMYPMITGAIALGGVMSYVSYHGSGGGKAFSPLMAFIFYIAPYFFLPKIAKMSGGAMGTIAGIAGNINKAGSARLNKSRQNMWAGRKERSKVGGLYGGNNWASKKLGNLGVIVGAPGRGKYNLGKKGSDARKTATGLARQTGTGNLEKDPRAIGISYDDDARAALMAGSESAARAQLKQRITDDRALYVKTNGEEGKVWNAEQQATAETGIQKAMSLGFNSSTQLFALKTEASNKSRNFKTVGQANATIKRIAQQSGVDETALREEFAFNAGNGGRADLRRLNGKVGEIEEARQAVEGANSYSTYQIGNGTSTAVENISAAHELLATKSGTDADKRGFAIWHKELQGIAQGGNGAAADTATKYAAAQDAQVQAILTDATIKDQHGNDGVVKGAVRMVEVTAPDPADPTKTITTRVAQPNPKPKTMLAEDVDRSARAYRQPNPEDMT